MTPWGWDDCLLSRESTVVGRLFMAVVIFFCFICGDNCLLIHCRCVLPAEHDEATTTTMPMSTTINVMFVSTGVLLSVTLCICCCVLIIWRQM